MDWSSIWPEIAAMGIGLIVMILSFVFYKLTGRKLSDLIPGATIQKKESDMEERIAILEEKINYETNTYAYPTNWKAVTKLRGLTLIATEEGTIQDGTEIGILDFDNENRTFTRREKKNG